jgi:hypothetical protein
LTVVYFDSFGGRSTHDVPSFSVVEAKCNSHDVDCGNPIYQSAHDYLEEVWSLVSAVDDLDH